ncbi:MAG TPA: metallophosphoesterase, partial [Candidatus Sulfotelmatobacter sp.]|nr:metallophosphoesterase [Candidatus Sulfotelmatobacter sp.]
QPQRNLLKLKRSALHSHYRKQVDELSDLVQRPGLSAFGPQNIWPWIKGYFKYAFNAKHPFVEYPAQGEQGLYPLQAADQGKAIKVAIAGDWGTGTEEAFKVAEGMLDFGPDYTIHLGDVYYVGDEEEVAENFLGKDAEGYAGVEWPKGRVGSFALTGNHEMYANGTAYYKNLLPTLGIPTSQDKKQLASFFCLENDAWRVLGLDTGYNSVGLPILGQIPLINKLPWVGADGKMESKMLDWLRKKINPAQRRLPTILLTHHQSFSAFEEGYPRPAGQLAEFFSGQQIVWIWGHEHRMAVYDKYTDANNITAYARCLGHGGMPVELKDVHDPSAPLQFYDHRTYASYDDGPVGFNGFLNVRLEGNKAVLDYRDVHNKAILQEEFTAAANGAISQAFTLVGPELTRGKAAPEAPLAQAAGSSAGK